MKNNAFISKVIHNGIQSFIRIKNTKSGEYIQAVYLYNSRLYFIEFLNNQVISFREQDK